MNRIACAAIVIATCVTSSEFSSADSNAQSQQIVLHYSGVVVNRPPDCSHAVASEALLWPPDHSYHSISILGVTDPDGDHVTIKVTGVAQDEPVNGRGDGDTCPDAEIDGAGVSLRAERAGAPGVSRRWRHGPTPSW